MSRRLINSFPAGKLPQPRFQLPSLRGTTCHGDPQHLSHAPQRRETRDPFPPAVRKQQAAGSHRGGNRQLNVALYRIAIVQARHHPPAHTYLSRPTTCQHPMRHIPTRRRNEAQGETVLATLAARAARSLEMSARSREQTIEYVKEAVVGGRHPPYSLHDQTHARTAGSRRRRLRRRTRLRTRFRLSRPGGSRPRALRPLPSAAGRRSGRCR